MGIGVGGACGMGGGGEFAGRGGLPSGALIEEAVHEVKRRGG